MFAAVLGLVSVFGAWVAWRRNPVYSPTATFRVLGELLLLISAAVCIIIVTVNLIQGFSQTLQIGVLLTVVVLVALGLVLCISAVATPKSTRINTALPANVPVLNLRRRTVTHWLKVFIVFCLICLAIGIIPGPTRYMVASVLGIGVLLAAVMLPIGYIMARRFDRSATALLLHPWLHWHYSAQEWDNWSATRVERLAAQPATFLLKRDWRRLLWVGAIVFGGALIFTPGGWIARVVWGLTCIGLIAGFVELAAWQARRAPAKLRTQLRSAAPDAYFGDDGLVCDDHLLTWLGADVYLVSAAADDRAPRSLVMLFQKLVPNPYGSPQTVSISQNVLIPGTAGAGDLTVLRNALAARCPRATLAF